MTERNRLNVLEERAERALEKAKAGWREFADCLAQIKASGAYRETHPRWSAYLRERWGTHFQLAYEAIGALEVAEAVESVSPTANIPNDVKALYKLKTVVEPEEKARIISESIAEPGNFRENVASHVKEYKGEPTVRDTLPPQEMEEVVPKALPEVRQFFHRVYSI